MEFNEIQKLVYEEYKQNGYLDFWNRCPPSIYNDEQRIADLAEVGLFNTEVSELLEDFRVMGYPMLHQKTKEEVADIIIRVLNFASRKGIDVESAIIAKNKANLERGNHHGKKI